MSRINILNATADDLAVEIVASAPVDGSSGDNADGRIVKYLTHFYIWHDASGEWKKFGNSTDITSLETRLSTQEVGQAAAESSLAAIDASLQTRISTEESAATSAVDSAQVRAEAAEGVISGNLSSELVNRAVDVEAEASRATSAEAVLSANLSSEVSARIVDVEAEATRAGAAEGSLQVRLAAEESVELSAEGSLNTREGAEESARLAGDNSLASAISSEASLARAGEGSLETRLSSEEDRVDAILAASTADKNTFVETVSFINAIDVAHDSQTSTEISSIDSAIASAESSRVAGDSSLQTRLSSEESAEASAEASLNTRMAGEESIELSAEGSLDARSSAEESLRLAEDTSLETSLSGAGSSRASGDSSLTTAASVEASTARSAELSAQSSISAAALARGTADTSLTTRLSIEESAMIVAVDSIEALRSAGDLSLTTRVAAEESVEASAEVSLDARISSAIAARNSEDDSLETRLSVEESNELSAETSLDTRVSSEASAQVLADGSLETRFSGELSSERSKLDSILDSADADKDTFVEIVSFITSVDTESDDALASYVVTIDAAVSTEISTARSAEAVLSAGVSSEASAMTSAIAATYSVQKAAIDVHAGNITDAEQHEGAARHMRIDFTSQTSFTVPAIDLPTNFEPGNGMAQVFQDMGSNKFRHLVAPASYNASTGAMSFDLGTTSKSGFVVFYSFAGDESSASEVQLNADMYISGFDGSGLSDDNGGSSSIVLTFEGVGSEANAKKHYNLLTPHSVSATNYGATFKNAAVAGSSSVPLGVSWNTDYTELTLSWTNTQTPTNYSGYQFLYVYWGTTQLHFTPLQVYIKIDATTKALQTDTGLGATGLTGDMHVHPPYALSSNGISAYSQYNTWATGDGKSFRGPAWTFTAYDAISSVGNLNNNGAGSSNQQVNSGYVTMTIGGVDKYMKATISPSVTSTHRLYSEIYGSRSALTVPAAYSLHVRWLNPGNGTDFKLGYYGRDTSGRISNTQASAPDTNTSVNFYFPADSGSAAYLMYSQITHADAMYDLKITVAMDDGAAGNMSMTVYRSDATLSSPSWTEVDRAYYGGHNIS